MIHWSISRPRAPTGWNFPRGEIQNFAVSSKRHPFAKAIAKSWSLEHVTELTAMRIRSSAACSRRRARAAWYSAPPPPPVALLRRRRFRSRFESRHHVSLEMQARPTHRGWPPHSSSRGSVDRPARIAVNRPRAGMHCAPREPGLPKCATWPPLGLPRARVRFGAARGAAPWPLTQDGQRAIPRHEDHDMIEPGRDEGRETAWTRCKSANDVWRDGIVGAHRITSRCCRWSP